MINLCDVKDFDDLDSNISATRHADKLILLMTSMSKLVKTIRPGKERLVQRVKVKCNRNCLLLLRKCAEQYLLITNTVSLLSTNLKQEILDESPIQTLTSHRLFHGAENRYTGC